MSKKFAILCGLIFLISLTAHAQDSDKVELYGGYAFLHVDTSPSFNQNGWELSGQYKFLPWLGAVGDFSGDYGSHSTTTYYMFGPQVSWPARVSPFDMSCLEAYTLVLRFPGYPVFPMTPSRSLSEAALMRKSSTVSLAHFQGDWIHSSVFGGSQNNARVSTGIVIKF